MMECPGTMQKIALTDCQRVWVVLIGQFITDLAYDYVAMPWGGIHTNDM